MLYLPCTMITGVDLAHYRVSRAKEWVSVDCGIKCLETHAIALKRVHCMQKLQDNK